MKLKRTPAPPSVLKPQVNSSVDICRYSSTLLEIPCTTIRLPGGADAEAGLHSSAPSI